MTLVDTAGVFASAIRLACRTFSLPISVPSCARQRRKRVCAGVSSRGQRSCPKLSQGVLEDVRSCGCHVCAYGGARRGAAAPRIDEAAVIPLPPSGLDSRLVMVMNACEVGDLWRLPAVVAHYLAAAAGTRRVRWDGVALVRARGRCSRIA